MAYALVTPPAQEVITLQQAKNHLRVDTTEDDALIQALIIAARQRYEGPLGITGTLFLTQTWDYFADSAPSNGILEIGLGPVQSITSISNAGVLLDPSSYETDLRSLPARIYASAGWPTPSGLNSLNVRYVGGYGDTVDKVPQLVTQTMLVAIGYWYANRGGYGSAEFPRWIDELIWPFKRRWLM